MHTFIPLSAGPTATPPELHVRLFVKGHNVALRAGPSKDAQILDRLPRGTIVDEFSRENGWAKVRHPISQREGWISASLLTAEQPSTEEKAVNPTGPKPTIVPVAPAVPELSTTTIVQRLLAESISSYPGGCPCPESRDRGGRRCGARSAYTKPGGYNPLCYASDVTPDMIAAYRQREANAH